MKRPRSRRASFTASARGAVVAGGVLVASCFAAGHARNASADPSGPASVASPSKATSSTSSSAALSAGRVNGADYLRMLGPHAADILAPNTGMIGALVALPRGKTAADYGLDQVAPGIGRLRAPRARIEAFGFAHPDLRMEIAPPLHPLLDHAGLWVRSELARTQRGADGRGVLVGVADTGLDVTNPEMIDANGKSRVAWMLDLSLLPVGVHADLETKYGILDSTGKTVTAGAVLDNTMIDALLAKLRNGTCIESNSKLCAPSDVIGHGTHVTGIAAARGATNKYPGMAPAADIVFVRVTRGPGEGIENDDLTRAVQFMFDRADAEKKPMVVNLSLGSDFGPHDGSFMWEQVIASYIGPTFPGHAVVAAAGNSGSIVETPIHQSVRATKGATLRVPITTGGADSGSVQVWVTLHDGADLSIGLDGPDGEWIAPIDEGHQNGKNTEDYDSGVIYGSGLDGSPIPNGSRGAVVVWSGKWPTGTYSVTFEGTGSAELYLQGLGDATLGGDRQATFTNGVREGTINLPATHPAIIGVGCTVNRTKWISIGDAEVGLRVPLLDGPGGLPASPGTAQHPLPVTRDLAAGEVCWFSSAGPTATGMPKPEISAPGALVISALSRSAKPGGTDSIFTNPACPTTKANKTDPRCLQIDDTHGIAVGTSMSSPMVAGVVALLLQKDPTLTQDKILALLQGGAHHFRGAAPFDDQSGPGEVDAVGALDALDMMKNPALQLLPSASQSWLTLSGDYVPADGSSPFTAIVELRTDDAQHRADFFDTNRLQPVLLVDGAPVGGTPALIRRGPGVWFFAWKPPAGLGGSLATFGATFDGAPIVSPRTVPIAADRWEAAYPSTAAGSSCGVAAAGAETGAAGPGAGAILLAALAMRRRRTRAPRIALRS